MASMLPGNFYDLVDGKFLVLRKMPGQPEIGTMIHVMDTYQDQTATVIVSYRITETGQSNSVKFKTLKEFYNWARPDSFIARNYDSFSKSDIQHYIRVKKRTPASYCLPLIAIMMVVVWAAMLFLLDMPLNIIFAIVLSVVGIFLIFMSFKKQKSNMKMKMYQKIVTKWGIQIK